MVPTLHVAAMPFPTRQGTQVAVHAMLEALPGTAELFTYGESDVADALPSYPWHRLSLWPRATTEKSFRSGPSWRKVVLDLRMSVRVRQLHSELPSAVVVAH